MSDLNFWQLHNFFQSNFFSQNDQQQNCQQIAQLFAAAHSTFKTRLDLQIEAILTEKAVLGSLQWASTYPRWTVSKIGELIGYNLRKVSNAVRNHKTKPGDILNSKIADCKKILYKCHNFRIILCQMLSKWHLRCAAKCSWHQKNKSLYSSTYACTECISILDIPKLLHNKIFLKELI